MDRIFKILMVLFLAGLCSGTTYVIKENGKEVGRYSVADGKSTVEVVHSKVIKPEPASAAQAAEMAEDTAPEHHLKPVLEGGPKKISAKKRRAYEALSKYKFFGPYCRHVKKVAAGLETESALPLNQRMKYNEWREKNPAAYSDCYTIGLAFGDKSYKEIEDIKMRDTLTPAEYRLWKEKKGGYDRDSDAD